RITPPALDFANPVGCVPIRLREAHPHAHLQMLAVWTNGQAEGDPVVLAGDLKYSPQLANHHMNYNQGQ
ncbi:endonuclease/exonuclease/phosphatase family protein, partial [Enterobacter hormaechei]